MTNYSRQPNVLVVLTTHAHSLPLRPAPQLKYDLRTIPNPPKAIRDLYTGVSKRLRDHMREHNVFVELLERAETEIRATVESMIEQWKADKELEGSTTDDDSTNKEDESKNEEQEAGESDAADEEEVENCRATKDAMKDSDRLVFIVGIFCARGQHRSVAFAEELSRASWPRNWEILVTHRDLGQKRGGTKNHSGRYRRVIGADMLEDE